MARAHTTWFLKRENMLAIIPKPEESLIHLHALSGQHLVMTFTPAVQHGAPDGRMLLQLAWRCSSMPDQALVMAETIVDRDKARRVWRHFVDSGIPEPVVLRPEAFLRKDAKFWFAASLIGLLSLGAGAGIGWWAVGSPGFLASFRTLTTSAPIATPTAERTKAEGEGTRFAVSPAARDALEERAGRAGVGANAAASQSHSEALDGGTLLALHELREVMERGERVSPALFRRLPSDIQAMLRSEGLAPEEGGSRTSSSTPENSPRLPTGAVLRGGSDMQGVPLLPRQLPGGTGGRPELPMPGGGDLRGSEDFLAFGLQPPQ